jgi:osmotically-inducible protein OsmY
MMFLSDIVEAAQNKLRDSVIRSVLCEYNDGVLVLRGRSGSYYEKQVAQEAVKRIEGVSRVVNQIEVFSESI